MFRIKETGAFFRWLGEYKPRWRFVGFMSCILGFGFYAIIIGFGFKLMGRVGPVREPRDIIVIA